MTITWNLTATATSSIAHAGETRGTTTLLRRELIVTADGALVPIPIISGNHLRGRLRRVGEELLRDVLQYDNEISPAAAHALRGGGALVKTTKEPLSGRRLQRLRELIPQIAVFGAAGGGVIISGALDVGKVVPHLQETAHITKVPSTRSAFNAVQLEDYSRQDDTDSHDFTPTIVTITPPQAHQMRFQIETFPIGTTFSSWLRLRRPTSSEHSFFADVLTEYQQTGLLGARISQGHGHIDLTATSTGHPPALVDWREHAKSNRDEILTILEDLT